MRIFNKKIVITQKFDSGKELIIREYPEINNGSVMTPTSYQPIRIKPRRGRKDFYNIGRSELIYAWRDKANDVWCENLRKDFKAIGKISENDCFEVMLRVVDHYKKGGR